MNLNANKATGLDKIPAKVLSLSVDIIASSLTYIFNLFLETCIYINDWKRERVIPIYKSEDRRKCENYRPIFILPVERKVFEKEVFGQLYPISQTMHYYPDFNQDLDLNIRPSLL